MFCIFLLEKHMVVCIKFILSTILQILRCSVNVVSCETMNIC